MLVLLEVADRVINGLVEAEPEVERLDRDALVLGPGTVFHQREK